MKKKVKRIENVEIVEGRELGQLAAIKYLSKGKSLIPTDFIGDLCVYAALAVALASAFFADLGFYMSSGIHPLWDILVEMFETLVLLFGGS